MTLQNAKRLFKKHYKNALRLKEGGKAWQREISKAQKYKNVCIFLYNQQLREKYSN